eukprot:UN25852
MLHNMRQSCGRMDPALGSAGCINFDDRVCKYGFSSCTEVVNHIENNGYKSCSLFHADLDADCCLSCHALWLRTKSNDIKANIDGTCSISNGYDRRILTEDNIESDCEDYLDVITKTK